MKPFDQAGKFLALNENGHLPGSTVRNAGITIFAQASVFAIQLLGTMILARILTPTDFGLVTMITTFSLLLSSFGLAGFTEAVLQSEVINHRLASNLFWINMGGALILSTGFAAAGSLLAKFYSNPHIVHASIGFSLVIFFSIVPVLHLSLLKRAMLFGAVSVNDIVGRIVYVFTAVCGAYLSWGYWALVAGAGAQAISVCLGAWILCPWFPGVPQRAPGTGRMIRYAISVYGRFCLSYCNGNTDNLLVGWRFGAQALGVYKKAFDLFVLPSCQLLSPILAVVVATLSRKNQDRAEYKRFFLKGLCIIAFVGMAISVDLTLIGRDIVRLLLGSKWGESGRIFTYFAPGIGFMLIYQTSGWIHLSLGTTGRWLRWTVAEVLVTIMLFVFALRWGPVGIATAWTASFCVLAIPAFWYAGTPIELSVTSVIHSVWRYVIASLIAGIACARIVGYMRWQPLIEPFGLVGVLARIFTNSVLFTLLYLAAVFTLFGSLEPLRQLVRLLPDLLPGALSRRRSTSVENLSAL